jgi:hypothetical protein
MKTTYQLASLAILISACLAQPILAGKVQAHIGLHVDLSQYKTYSWLRPRVLTKAGIDENNPVNPVLKEMVVRQLSLKGLSEVADGGDLMIQAYALTESTPQLEAVIMAEGPGMDYGTPIATMGRYNRQGTLALNLIDRRTKKYAWFAMVTDSIPTGTLKPAEIRTRLEKAATELFKKYPVKK